MNFWLFPSHCPSVKHCFIIIAVLLLLIFQQYILFFLSTSFFFRFFTLLQFQTNTTATNKKVILNIIKIYPSNCPNILWNVIDKTVTALKGWVRRKNFNTKWHHEDKWLTIQAAAVSNSTEEYVKTKFHDIFE